MSEDLSREDAMALALRSLGRLPPARPLPLDGAQLVVHPREEGLQDKTISAENLAKKIISCRDKLRVLEQRVNASGMSQDEKLALEMHITSLYDAIATLTALFSDDALPASDDESGEPA
jgi:hypothetical protein